MSKRYHEIMENIQLTPETREQILCHVSERERKAKVQTMKKWTKYHLRCSVLRAGRGSCLWNSYVTSGQNSQ